jgi:hypothetical protein
MLLVKFGSYYPWTCAVVNTWILTSLAFLYVFWNNALSPVNILDVNQHNPTVFDGSVFINITNGV